jgi:leucine efflux protein
MQALFHIIGISDVWQLIAATAVFLLLPGPGTFCMLTCSAKHGWRGGFVALAGLMLGDIVLMFLAAIGVAAMLHANPLLFKGMQYLGAVYLGYLGLRLLWTRGEGAAAVVPFSNMADFRRGFFVTLMNPKAIVFYMAFFPLFIDPATAQGAVTFIAMGTVICTCSLIYGSLLVLIGNTAARHLGRNRKIAALASRAAGIFLIGFGIKLGTQ